MKYQINLKNTLLSKIASLLLNLECSILIYIKGMRIIWRKKKENLDCSRVSL